MILKKVLIDTFKNYHHETFFYDKGIPSDKLSNARRAMAIPDDENVYALIDFTVFGAADDGVVFSDSGIYTKNIGEDVQYLSYEQLRQLSISEVTDGIFIRKIRFNNGFTINCSGGKPAFVSKVIEAVLDNISNLIGDNDDEVNETLWYVGVGESQQGPLTLQKIISLIESKQINPHDALVWCDGMDDWVVMNTIETFSVKEDEKKLIRDTNGKLKSPPMLREKDSIGEIQSDSSGTDKNAEVVDINNADTDQILMLPGLQLSHANKLIEERRTRLGFTTVEEIASVLDLAPHVAENIRSRIVFTPFATSTKSKTNASRRIIDF